MVKKKKFRVVICIVSLLVSLIEKENWFPLSITLTVTTIYQVRDPYIRSHHIYLCCYVYMYMCLCLYLRVYDHSWSRSTILVMVKGDVQVDYGRRTGYLSEAY